MSITLYSTGELAAIFSRLETKWTPTELYFKAPVEILPLLHGPISVELTPIADGFTFELYQDFDSHRTWGKTLYEGDRVQISWTRSDYDSLRYLGHDCGWRVLNSGWAVKDAVRAQLLRTKIVRRGQSFDLPLRIKHDSAAMPELPTLESLLSSKEPENEVAEEIPHLQEYVVSLELAEMMPGQPARLDSWGDTYNAYSESEALGRAVAEAMSAGPNMVVLSYKCTPRKGVKKS